MAGSRFAAASARVAVEVPDHQTVYKQVIWCLVLGRQAATYLQHYDLVAASAY